MKRIFIVLMIFLVWARPVYGEEYGLIDEYSKSYGELFDKNMQEIVPNFNSEEILKGLNSGELSLSPKKILEYTINAFLGEVGSAAKLLAIVLVMAVLCSYLSGLKDGFGSNAVANCAFYTCYIIMAGVVSTAFYDTAVCTSETVHNTAFFMQFAVPIIITMLVTSGAVVSATTLEPTLLAIVEVAVFVIETVFIPAVMISAALNIVNGMSEKFKTDRMVKLIGNAVRWGLTVTLTIFVSLAGLKSIAAGGVDGLTLRLGKFATSNLIPMVGGILAESVETVMSCSVLIKNSVGILGIICVVIITLHPVLKIGAILIMFRIAAAVTEPVSEPKVVSCLSGLGDSISVLFSMLAAVTVMFIMVLTILINAGGV